MILGIDWGERKVGLAVAHLEVAIASAFGVVENNQGVFVRLQEIIDENDITEIVIGKTRCNEQNDNEEKINLFAKKCKEKLGGIHIDFVEEMFTTKEAHENLKMAGKKKIGEIDDAEAARIILQQYVDGK